MCFAEWAYLRHGCTWNNEALNLIWFHKHMRQQLEHLLCTLWHCTWWFSRTSPLDMWSGLGWSLLASTERRNESLATCSQGWSLMTRVWEEISIGSVWKTFRFSQQGLMMISLHQDRPCDSQNIRWSTNKKETKKERGEKKSPSTKKQRERNF